MQDLYVAWWNLENLFDSVRSAQRPEWLQKKLASELAGWTTAVRDRKIGQLASVINAMNGGRGPDILGVCEVENRPVLEKLVAKLNPDRHYAVEHHDTSDERGIDVAFIYDPAIVAAHKQFNYVVLRRNATRDIFQVNFQTTAGNTLICIGNHWPSRSGGELDSRPYRQMAGETLAYWLERIRAIQGPGTAVVVLGDFNDEPFDSSLTGQGTHFYADWGMLDQILVNRALLSGDGPFRLVQDSVEILSTPGLLKSGKPRRFGRPSSTLDEDGFSDHLPVACRIRER